MKIETFNTLQAVLDSGTLAGASKLLHLTPSAVSMQMKQLESYVGQQLFDRSGLEVKALPAAFELAETMRSMLQRLDTFRRRPGFEVEGHIHMGIIESMMPVLLPDILKRLRERYPKLHLQTRRGKSAELTNAVKAGELDAAIVGQPARPSTRLSWQPLLAKELSLVVPPHEKERSFDALFQRYEWIRYDRSTISGAMAAKYIHQHFRDKNSEMEFDSARAIVALVSAGLGISLLQLIEPAITTVYPVQVIRVPDAPVLQYSLVTRKSDADNRALSALREVLISVISPSGKAVNATTDSRF